MVTRGSVMPINLLRLIVGRIFTWSIHISQSLQKKAIINFLLYIKGIRDSEFILGKKFESKST